MRPGTTNQVHRASFGRAATICAPTISASPAETLAAAATRARIRAGI
jgi:hypothetical protein